MSFLCGEAGVCLWLRDSVIHEDPGVELLLLHTQQEPVEVLCAPGREAHQVLLQQQEAKIMDAGSLVKLSKKEKKNMLYLLNENHRLQFSLTET